LTVGVIAHLHNPTPGEAVEMAVAAEAAGADWVGVADAFWWRDVWMLLAEVARATNTISIGPTVTNAYLRHPFHTVSALATLQELAPGRVFLGIGAGGSEITAAAGIPRSDASARVEELIGTVRRVAANEALDPGSGRRLELELEPVPILVAARGTRLLRTAGEVADRVLLLSVPESDLERSAGVVHGAAAHRIDPPELAWAPLVEHDPSLRTKLRNIAVYAAINSTPVVRESWGLDDEGVDLIRAALVAGGTQAALELVPESALADLVLADRDPAAAAARGRDVGATSIVVPCHDAATVGDHIAWAREVVALMTD
jgi:5,10-methylenetetrahydromethanopterin reductase